MMSGSGTKLKHAAQAVCFLLIAAALYVMFTYVTRNIKPHHRINILGLYMEEENSLDVVAVGASSTYRFWNPMRAYETEGFTSYSYSCGNMLGAMMRTAVEDVLAHQDPELILIDGRRFLDLEVNEEGDTIRPFLDSLDEGITRLKGLYRYAKAYDLTLQEFVPLLLDLCYYHDNYDALISMKHWRLADNRVSEKDLNPFYIKGFGLISTVNPQERPVFTDMDKCIELSEEMESAYRDFLEYCRSLNRKFLIVISPAVVGDEELWGYNTLEKIAGEYGIPFWNGVRYYDEMGVDFQSDYYNPKHMNFKGAVKYTDYLTAYLKEHYDLPDHRGEEAYSSWEKAFKNYKKRRKTVMKRMRIKMRDKGLLD